MNSRLKLHMMQTGSALNVAFLHVSVLMAVFLTHFIKEQRIICNFKQKRMAAILLYKRVTSNSTKVVKLQQILYQKYHAGNNKSTSGQKQIVPPHY